MIRILHILHSMNRGGAEAMLMNYYRNIDREKVQFDFLLTEPNHCQYEDEIVEMGGLVFRVPLLRFSNPLPYINGIKHFLQEHSEYKIVHSHTSSKSAVPLWVAKTCGVPVRACHAHSSNSGSGIEGLVRGLLGVWLKRVATDFFACGVEAGRCWYGDKLVDDGRVVIAPNAVDCEKYAFNEAARVAIRSKYDIKDGTKVLGMVARFHPVKNHLFALDVVKKLVSEKQDVKLLLVGDGEMHQAIVEKINSLNLSQYVIFAGIVSDVHNYLQAMDVVLMPSFNEGLPVSIIEAQASGVKCILSTGVPKEVDVTGNVSFLPLDEDQWVEKIKTIDSHWRDSNAGDKVRKAGYDIKYAAKELHRFYISKYNRLSGNEHED